MPQAAHTVRTVIRLHMGKSPGGEKTSIPGKYRNPKPKPGQSSNVKGHDGSLRRAQCPGRSRTRLYSEGLPLMKCEKCELEATVHELRVVNGKRVERHLCEKCARE